MMFAVCLACSACPGPQALGCRGLGLHPKVVQPGGQLPALLLEAPGSSGYGMCLSRQPAQPEGRGQHTVPLHLAPCSATGPAVT